MTTADELVQRLADAETFREVCEAKQAAVDYVAGLENLSKAENDRRFRDAMAMVDNLTLAMVDNLTLAMVDNLTLEQIQATSTTANDNTLRLVIDKLEEYDSADHYHDCAELIAEARDYLARAQQCQPTNETP